MSVLDKLKLSYAHMQLKREASAISRLRTDPDIHRAGTIGILYDATDRESFEFVREFYRDLKESRKCPVSLGYIDFKETLSFHPLARPEADYFFKSQVNWLQKPNCPMVDNFIDEPFDILINLTLQDNYSLDHIAAVSKAGLKIGRAQSAVAFCYDMTFQLDPQADLKTFAYTIVHYLSQINHEHTSNHQRKRSSHYYTV
jgi:hypothetical protein